MKSTFANGTRKIFSIYDIIHSSTDRTDTPHKTLKLKKKRIIKRSDIPASKLTKTGKAPVKPVKPKNQRPKAPAKPKPEFSPSDLRARELYKRLNDFEVWRNYQPLALGVEKAIFKICNDEQFSGGSKKVVQKVLRMHTARDIYRANVAKGGKRYQLDANEGGKVTEDQKALAKKQLAIATCNLKL